jgi:hypothetical protein
VYIPKLLVVNTAGGFSTVSIMKLKDEPVDKADDRR